MLDDDGEPADLPVRPINRCKSASSTTMLPFS